MLAISGLQRLTQEDYQGFKDSLGLIVDFRIAWTMSKMLKREGQKGREGEGLAGK